MSFAYHVYVLSCFDDLKRKQAPPPPLHDSCLLGPWCWLRRTKRPFLPAVCACYCCINTYLIPTPHNAPPATSANRHLFFSFLLGRCCAQLRRGGIQGRIRGGNRNTSSNTGGGWGRGLYVIHFDFHPFLMVLFRLSCLNEVL